MVLELALPKSDKKYDESGVDNLINMFFQLAASVAGLRLSSTAKDKLQSTRRAILESQMKEDHAAREEQLQQRLEEKAAREKKLYESMTPAQKRKWTEHEEKKKLKKEKKRAAKRCVAVCNECLFPLMGAFVNSVVYAA